MYDNIIKYGVDSQIGVYKEPGENVIKVFDSSKSREENIRNMTAQIYKEGPTNVSRHCADLSVLNVFDIALSSISGNATEKKLELERLGHNVLNENGCLHIEIKQ